MGELIEINSGRFIFDPGQAEGLRELDGIFETDPSALAQEPGLGLRLGIGVMAAAAPDMALYHEAGEDPSAHQLVEGRLVGVYPVQRSSLVRVAIQAPATDGSGFALLPYAEEAQGGFVWVGKPVPIDGESPVGSEPVAGALRNIARWTAEAVRHGMHVSPDFTI